MTREQALDTIKKLLALSTSENENEAAVAAAHAQKLMEKFRIERAEAELHGQEIHELPTETAPLLIWRSEVRWKTELLGALSEANNCTVLITRVYWGGGANVAGHPSNIALVICLYKWAEKELQRLVNKHGYRRGQVWRNSYLFGAISGIKKKLTEAKATVRAESVISHSTALLVVERQMVEVKDFLLAAYPKIGKGNGELKSDGSKFGGELDIGAYYRGQTDGRKLNIGAKQLDVSKKELGDGTG
jgi:Protein of unknown function (DUF2786)